MRNYIIYLSLLCLALVSISCERKEPGASATKQSQKKIKTIMETMHDPIDLDGEVDHNPEISENSSIFKTFYSQTGALLIKDQFNSVGNRENRTTFKYDEKGRLIERVNYHFKTVTSRLVNKFNASHKLIESNEYDEAGKNTIRTRVITADDGQKVVVSYSLEKGALVKTSESFYDEGDHVVETRFYTDQRLTGRETNIFDHQGNLVETKILYPFKKEEQTMHFKYDSSRNKIETIVLNGSLMIESKVLTRYDDKGNLKELIRYGIKGNVKERIAHLYAYDQEKNWIKDVTFINKKPTSVTIRKIEYY